MFITFDTIIYHKRPIVIRVYYICFYVGEGVLQYLTLAGIPSSHIYSYLYYVYSVHVHVYILNY